MDKDRVKGKLKDIGGRVKRQAGEWTGDKDAQTKGTAKQAEGKIQNTVGKAKDAVRHVADDLRRPRTRDDEVVEERHDVKVKRPRKAA